MPRSEVDPSREQVLKILRRTETTLSFPKLLFEYSSGAADLPDRDRAFIYQLAMGVLRHRGTLDWALKGICRTALDKLTPWIRNILRLGLYQIIFLDRVPKSAAVDESVKLAKKYGHAGTARLVNAVLRNADRETILGALHSVGEDSISDIAAKYSHPQWLAALLIEEWGKERAIQVMKCNNEIPPLTARVNTLRTTRAGLLDKLEGAGVHARALPQTDEAIEFPAGSAPWTLDAHAQGLFYLQDASSIVAARCLGAEPGQQVLDVCAGPGGKTTHLAALMQNSGIIHALDIHKHRLTLLEENARRLGAVIVNPCKQDATALLATKFADMDRVLADAPCSGIGVARRHVELKWRLQPQQIRELARLQAGIIERAAECVRPGGALLYCTCTVTRSENSAVVNDFLLRHREFSVCAELPPFAQRYLTSDGFVQIMPGDENMDGFFVARLVRL